MKISDLLSTTVRTRLSIAAAFIIASTIGFAGCQVIGGIFKAGFVVGIIVVIVIIAAIFGIARMFKK